MTARLNLDEAARKQLILNRLKNLKRGNDWRKLKREREAKAEQDRLSAEHNGRAKYGRSRLTNESRREPLPGVDGRTVIFRRFKDIARQIAKDQGGLEELSEVRLQLVRRFAAAAVTAERLEAKLADGGDLNIDEHSRLVSSMVRLAARIGVDRRSKNVTPMLSDYLDMKVENYPEGQHFEGLR
jgi:hypothetical protein